MSFTLASTLLFLFILTFVFLLLIAGHHHNHGHHDLHDRDVYDLRMVIDHDNLDFHDHDGNLDDHGDDGNPPCRVFQVDAIQPSPDLPQVPAQQVVIPQKCSDSPLILSFSGTYD